MAMLPTYRRKTYVLGEGGGRCFCDAVVLVTVPACFGALAGDRRNRRTRLDVLVAGPCCRL